MNPLGVVAGPSLRRHLSLDRADRLTGECSARYMTRALYARPTSSHERSMKYTVPARNSGVPKAIQPGCKRAPTILNANGIVFGVTGRRKATISTRRAPCACDSKPCLHGRRKTSEHAHKPLQRRAGTSAWRNSSTAPSPEKARSSASCCSVKTPPAMIDQ